MSAALVKVVGSRAIGTASRAWPAHSRLFLVGDGGWVISRETVEVGRVAERLGIRLGNQRLAPHVRGQSVFYGSHFAVLTGEPLKPANRLGVAYFHGRPGTEGYPEFDRAYASLAASHERVERVQVTHAEMREIVLSTGIDPAKVHTIPIGINLSQFPLRDPEARAAARARLGIPADAVVVGSIQKDGVGFGAGDEPKLVKGPDVFLEVVARLHADVPELFVLLGGPSRGYVRRGLDGLGVSHVYVDAGEDFGLVAELYRALDLYVVASRQEGGPKAVFESWATGVPLVTTRVGQAGDLVRHGVNGWVADVEDVEALAGWALHALEHPQEAYAVVRQAREDVGCHAYDAQAPLWRELFSGFVSW